MRCGNPIFSAFCDERGGPISTVSLGTSGANAAVASSYDVCITEDGEECTEYSYYSLGCNTDVSEETVSESPGDGTDSLASPIFQPSNTPTRAMVGTANSSGAVLVENPEGKEVDPKTWGNVTDNITSPSLKPSANSTIQTLGDTANQSDSVTSTYPTAVESSTPPSPVSSPVPSPHPSTAPSTAPSDVYSDMPSATLTEDTAFDYDFSGGGRLNYFSCTGLLVPLLGLIFISLMTL